MTRPSDEWIGQVYDRYGAALYRYAVMVLADPAGAADVVQTVFVALLRRRSNPDVHRQAVGGAKLSSLTWASLLTTGGGRSFS